MPRKREVRTLTRRSKRQSGFSSTWSISRCSRIRWPAGRASPASRVARTFRDRLTLFPKPGRASGAAPTLPRSNRAQTKNRRAMPHGARPCLHHRHSLVRSRFANCFRSFVDQPPSGRARQLLQQRAIRFQRPKLLGREVRRPCGASPRPLCAAFVCHHGLGHESAGVARQICRLVDSGLGRKTARPLSAPCSSLPLCLQVAPSRARSHCPTAEIACRVARTWSTVLEAPSSPAWAAPRLSLARRTRASESFAAIAFRGPADISSFCSPARHKSPIVIAAVRPCPYRCTTSAGYCSALRSESPGRSRPASRRAADSRLETPANRPGVDVHRSRYSADAPRVATSLRG